MAKNNQTELGRKINERLKELRWSQRELSRRTDISHSNISKIMRGVHRPTPETLTALGEELGLNPFHLMRLAGIPLPEDKNKRDPTIEHIAQRLERLSPKIKPLIISSIDSQISAIEAVENLTLAKTELSDADLLIVNRQDSKKVLMELSAFLSSEDIQRLTKLQSENPDHYNDLVELLRETMYDIIQLNNSSQTNVLV